MVAAIIRRTIHLFEDKDKHSTLGSGSNLASGSLRSISQSYADYVDSRAPDRTNSRRPEWFAASDTAGESQDLDRRTEGARKLGESPGWWAVIDM